MSTQDPRWTHEAPEVVTAAIRKHTDRLLPADSEHGPRLSCTCGGLNYDLTQPDLAPAMAVYRLHRAEAVLGALTEAGLLAPTDRCPSCEHSLSRFHQPEGCWFAVTTGRLDQNVVCACATLPSRQADEPGAPRVWAMPEIPADVRAVRDGEGFVWRRVLDVDGGVWRRSTGAWTGDIVRSMTARPELGPLTEVDGSQT